MSIWYIYMIHFHMTLINLLYSAKTLSFCHLHQLSQGLLYNSKWAFFLIKKANILSQNEPFSTKITKKSCLLYNLYEPKEQCFHALQVTNKLPGIFEKLFPLNSYWKASLILHSHHHILLYVIIWGLVLPCVIVMSRYWIQLLTFIIISNYSNNTK